MTLKYMQLIPGKPSAGAWFALRYLKSILEALNSKGVSVSFLSENLKFSASQEDPFSQLQLQLLGAFSKFERAIIRKRQAEGISKAKAKGVYRDRQPSIDAEQVQALNTARSHRTERNNNLHRFSWILIGKSFPYRSPNPCI